MGNELNGSPNSVLDSPSYILLYDGLCGFCNSTIQLIIRNDKRGTMKFAALHSVFGQALLQQHPSLQQIDSLILIDRTDPLSEIVFSRSDGALMVARYLGGFWTLFLVLWTIPRPIRDFFYDLFARHRFQLFGKYESCPVPAPEIRSRFLE